MAIGQYKVLITRSCYGNFCWAILNSNGKKLTESGMLTRYASCKKVVYPIAKILNAKIEFLDLEGDVEL